MIEPWDPLAAAYATLCAFGLGLVFMSVLWAMGIDSKYE